MTTVPSSSLNDDDLSLFIPEVALPALSMINSIESLVIEDGDVESELGYNKRIHTQKRNREHEAPEHGS